jgi:hypothetical protein
MNSSPKPGGVFDSDWAMIKAPDSPQGSHSGEGPHRLAKWGNRRDWFPREPGAIPVLLIALNRHNEINDACHLYKMEENQKNQSLRKWAPRLMGLLRAAWVMSKATWIPWRRATTAPSMRASR